jgi:choline dehydrogenase-like flavoprotein
MAKHYDVIFAGTGSGGSTLGTRAITTQQEETS